MKTVKFAIVALIATVFSSCVPRFVPQGQPMAIRPMGQMPPQGGQPMMGHQMGQHPQMAQQQGGQRKLSSITVTKRQTGYCQARIWQGPANTPQNVQRVADYASSVYEKTGRVPSEQALTAKFGFKAQARWIDTPDRIVGKVIVRPDEVPANIRAKFM